MESPLWLHGAEGSKVLFFQDKSAGKDTGYFRRLGRLRSRLKAGPSQWDCHR